MLFSLPPQVLIILIFSLIFALTFHEFGHAYVAHLCGDDTAKQTGRISPTDLALTLGMGVGLNNYSNLIDLGLKIGKINNSIFDDENYIKGNLSINIGEKWFTRSRRK